MCGVSEGADIFLTDRRLELVERLPHYVARSSHEGEGGSTTVLPRAVGLPYSAGATEDTLCKDHAGDLIIVRRMDASVASWRDDCVGPEGWP